MKKNILALVTVLALAACNNDANTNPTSETNVAEKVAKTAEIKTAKAAEPEKLPDLKIMPFGLPMAPNTRLFGFGIAQHFVGGLYHNAYGRLATKGNPKDVVDFYEKALADMGFKIFSKSNNGARPLFVARRDHTGDHLTMSAIKRSSNGSDMEAGELGVYVEYKMRSLDRKK